MNKSTTMDCRKNSQKMRSLTRTSALSFTLTVAFLLIATIHIVGAHDKSHHQQQDTAKNLNIRHQQLYDSIHYRGKRQDEQPTSSIAPDNVETTTNIPNDDKPAGTTTESSTTTSTTTTTTTTTTTKKPKTSMTVNYTQVDELFNMGYADEFVVAKWKNMSTGLQQGISLALKSISPKMVSMSSRVSGNCAGGLLKWILNLKNLRTWAVQMLDAAGKPTAGLLEGSLTMFGNYRQCLSVRAPDDDEIELTDQYKEYFRGRYCILHLKPYLAKKPQFYGLNATYKPLLRSYKYYEKTIFDEFSELAVAFNFINIRMDICVPSLCSRDDIQRVANQISDMVQMRAKVIRCDVEPLDSDPLMTDAHDFAWGSAMLLAVLVVVVSSLISVVYSMRRKQKSKMRALLTSMSIRRSIDQFKSIDCDRLSQTKPLAAYGLRVLVILWIFLVHASINLNFQFLREMMSLRRLIMEWPVQFLINSSLQFDTLIIITAFTVSYFNIDSNIKDLIKYTIDKYVRLVPSILFLAGLTILTPLFYQNHSPVWKDYVDAQSEVCKSTGLIDLTFLQNFLSYKHICLPQTWLFCVELQLLVLAIPLIAAINRSLESKEGSNKSIFKGPALFLPLLAILGWFINFLSIYTNELPPAWFHSFPDKEDKALYFSKHLMKTWNHLTPFAIGLLMGFVCKRQASKVFNNQASGSSGAAEKCVGFVFWMGAFGLMGAIIFSTYNWSMGLLPPIMVGALYNASARFFWSLACGAILYNVSVPNKDHQYSTVAQILGSKFFVLLGRLSFLAYMIFPYVHTFVLAIQEQPIFSSLFMMFHSFMSNVIITFLLAFVLSVLIELPFRRLVKKCALGRRHCTQLNISSSLSDCESPTLMKPAPKLMSSNSSNQPTMKEMNDIVGSSTSHSRRSSDESGNARRNSPAHLHNNLHNKMVDAHPMENRPTY